MIHLQGVITIGKTRKIVFSGRRCLRDENGSFVIQIKGE